MTNPNHPDDMPRAGDFVGPIMDQVALGLQQKVAARTIAMLEHLLPDDAAPEFVAAVLMGMGVGLMAEIYSRAPEPDLKKIREAWVVMGDACLTIVTEEP
jgi:hypothetical protein